WRALSYRYAARNENSVLVVPASSMDSKGYQGRSLCLVRTLREPWQSAHAMRARLLSLAESVVRLSRSIPAVCALLPPVLRTAGARIARTMLATSCSKSRPSSGRKWRGRELRRRCASVVPWEAQNPRDIESRGRAQCDGHFRSV